MQDLARERRAVDMLIQQAANWTPREAVAFLLSFDRRFRAVIGSDPSRVDRLILTSLLRRRALTDQ